MIERWSAKEDEILYRHYPYMGTDVVEMLPNRSRGSIRTRASLLSLSASMGRKPALVWTRDDDRIIREFYPTCGESMARYLSGKSPENVIARARQLGCALAEPLKHRKQHANTSRQSCSNRRAA